MPLNARQVETAKPRDKAYNALRQYCMSGYVERKWDVPHVLRKMAPEAVQPLRFCEDKEPYKRLQEM